MSLRQTHNPTLAFVVGTLLTLAGVLNVIVRSHHTDASFADRAEGFLVPGAFLVGGILWLAIGVRWRRVSSRARP